MSTTPATQLLCQQCTAVLPVDPGATIAVCEFCGTNNALDKSKIVLHYALRTTVRPDDATAALRRWMAGNDTVKNLDRLSKIGAAQLEMFPVWMARVKQGNDEKILLEPAAALSIAGLKHTTIPAADLIPYDQELDQHAVPATVPYNAMLEWLAGDYEVKAADIKEIVLVHLPLYKFKYEFQGRSFTALVDGATSKVFASIFPSKWETPYFAIGVIAFALYFCAAFIPVVSYLTGDVVGLGAGVITYLVVAVVIAIPIFIVAAIISARV